MDLRARGQREKPRIRGEYGNQITDAIMILQLKMNLKTQTVFFLRLKLRRQDGIQEGNLQSSTHKVEIQVSRHQQIRQSKEF